MLRVIGSMNSSNQDILKHTHAFKRTRNLISSAYSHLASGIWLDLGNIMSIKCYLSVERNDQPYESIKHGSLSASVRTDDSVYFSLFH